jgi:hypothetical protein
MKEVNAMNCCMCIVLFVVCKQRTIVYNSTVRRSASARPSACHITEIIRYLR